MQSQAERWFDHLSCRKPAKELGISKDVVHRIWRTGGLRPHRLERYMASNDPDFERKPAASHRFDEQVILAFKMPVKAPFR